MLKILTIADSVSAGKPHYYLSGYALDLQQNLGNVAEILHGLTNCAVCFHDEPETDAAQSGFPRELNHMNLIILLLSREFVQRKPAAYTVVFQHASQNGIPVIPVLLEEGIDDAVNRMLGDRHCLRLHQPDFAAQLERELLKISARGEQRMTPYEIFDAKLFLSYRKKDRDYAEALIRTIHDIDFCEGISVWYDNYLEPGDNFNEAIDKAMHEAEGVLLCVTPRFMEEGNYALTIEYPRAVQLGKPLLAIEADRTDPSFRRMYQLPDWIPVGSPAAIANALRQVFGDKLGARAGTPEHDFYLGLAYRDGYGVEIDRQRALRLIQEAADKDCMMAYAALRHMYEMGNCVPQSNDMAIRYQEKVVDYFERHPEESFGGYYLAENLYYLASDMERFGRVECVKVMKRFLQAAEQFFQQNDYQINPKSLEYLLFVRMIEVQISLSRTNLKHGHADAAESYIMQAYENSRLLEKLEQRSPRVLRFQTETLLIQGDLAYEQGLNEKAAEHYRLMNDVCLNAMEHAEELGSELYRFRQLSIIAKMRICRMSPDEIRAMLMMSCLNYINALIQEYSHDPENRLTAADFCRENALRSEMQGDIRTAYDYCMIGLSYLNQHLSNQGVLSMAMKMQLMRLRLCRKDRNSDPQHILQAIRDGKAVYDRFERLQVSYDALRDIGTFFLYAAESELDLRAAGMQKDIEQAEEIIRIVFQHEKDEESFYLLGKICQLKANLIRMTLAGQMQSHPELQHQFLRHYGGMMLDRISEAEDIFGILCKKNPGDHLLTEMHKAVLEDFNTALSLMFRLTLDLFQNEKNPSSPARRRQMTDLAAAAEKVAAYTSDPNAYALLNALRQAINQNHI